MFRNKVHNLKVTNAETCKSDINGNSNIANTVQQYLQVELIPQAKLSGINDTTFRNEVNLYWGAACRD